MTAVFYILFSSLRNQYYVGHTCDCIEERLRRHNSNHRGFTGGIGDWIVVYQEIYNDKALAYKREREVKGWKSKKRIQLLIYSSSN
jgi:putative endonuclease